MKSPIRQLVRKTRNPQFTHKIPKDLAYLGKDVSSHFDERMKSLGYDTSSPAPTVASSSSASKKRKVGRPRKLMYTSGSVRHLTETIVAKKPKSKSSLVGYLLSSKNRHLQTKVSFYLANLRHTRTVL
ncbi:hypothetical protein E2986_13144 [Frieseomelitta varia]|uniref:Uncharacterized protein n=1 Tax=Frieseomelitta varia TaxID=561572 RepID=A0A833RWZ4_9HYME|nr:hypothetical protein E2986_13144 [Frieseomelitta varia]